MYRLVFKRIVDIFLSGIGIFVSLPLWIIIPVVIWLEDRGPIFYPQERVGKDGKIFQSIKFRSMIPEAEKELGPVQARQNDPRDTKTGRVLRKTAMDELPQLLNILKGQMSFVGPRALRPAEIGPNDASIMISIFQIPGFKQRSSILPGLTGAAQVYASRNLAREEKFKYDLWYIDHMGFWLDIGLIAKSILNTINSKWDS